MNKEKSCGAVIYRKNNNIIEILLICHKNGGHWSFPKGHMEGDETEEMTAQREILEETGLNINLDTGFRQVVSYSPSAGVMKDVVYFGAECTYGSARAQPEEVSEIFWEESSAALKRVTYSNDRDVLKSFIEYLNLK